MKYQYNDGGREVAGYKGTAGDCCTRSIAIATGKPYQEVYDAINKTAKSETKKKSSAREGVYTKTAKKYLASLGLIRWVPCMQIGSGCKVHLRESELPQGRLIVRVSKHYTAVINGVINDTHDCSRGGTRCVYGYWICI